MRLEVRCCCPPTKLLGWVPVPGDVRGRILRFVVSPARWLLPSMSLRDEPAGVPRRLEADIIALPVAAWSEGPTRRGLALKSEETPIERLRLIPGFIEATDRPSLHGTPR